MRKLSFVVLAGSVLVGAAQAQPISLQNATATYSQTLTGNFFASHMIDGSITSNFSDGWAIFNGGVTANQTAALELSSDLNAPQIGLKMYQVYGTSHTLGRFRISVTSDDRATFCDGLQTGGDVTANWTVVTPSDMLLPAGVTYSVLGDGSILIGGANPATAIYAGTFDLPFNGVTGLRIEAIEDPAFPNNGPGRRDNGNFVLTEIECSGVPTPGAGGMLAIGGLMLARRRR